jgi:ferritin
MLSPTIEAAINKQLKLEISSAYTYLAMSAYCESRNFPGFAAWMKVQWQEELSHAMKLFGYLTDRGSKAVFEAIDKPQTEYASPHAMFNEVLKHEEQVTQAINGLYDLAIKENDHATQIELQWFIKEQVEEEKSVSDVLHMLRTAGDSGLSLMMLDRQLGQRAAK